MKDVYYYYPNEDTACEDLDEALTYLADHNENFIEGMEIQVYETKLISIKDIPNLVYSLQYKIKQHIVDVWGYESYEMYMDNINSRITEDKIVNALDLLLHDNGNNELREVKNLHSTIIVTKEMFEGAK